MCIKWVAKLILYVVNVVFFIVGAVIAILGAIAMTNFDTFVSILKVVPELSPMISMLQNTGTIDLFRNSSIALIVIGLFLLIISFLGCCGAKGEYRICLLAFCIVLGVLTAIQIALIIWTAVDRKAVEEKVGQELKRTMDFYNGTGMAYGMVGGAYVLHVSLSTEAYAWDSMQVGLECCGSNGPEDWPGADLWTNTYDLGNGSTVTDAKVPLSCCKVDDKEKFFTDINKMVVTNANECLTKPGSEFAQDTGCVHQVMGVILSYGNMTYIVIAFLLALQILEILCAVYVMKNADGVL